MEKTGMTPEKFWGSSPRATNPPKSSSGLSPGTGGLLAIKTKAIDQGLSAAIFCGRPAMIIFKRQGFGRSAPASTRSIPTPTLMRSAKSAVGCYSILIPNSSATKAAW